MERTEDIVDTLAVFQPAMGWLNADAEENILSMLLTEAIFHEPMFWLKADVEENICEQTQKFRPSTTTKGDTRSTAWIL